MTRLFYRFKEFRNTYLYDSNIFLRKFIRWLYGPTILNKISHQSTKVFFIFLSVLNKSFNLYSIFRVVPIRNSQKRKNKEKSIARILPHKAPQNCLELRCRGPPIPIGRFSLQREVRRSDEAKREQRNGLRRGRDWLCIDWHGDQWWPWSKRSRNVTIL